MRAEDRITRSVPAGFMLICLTSFILGLSRSPAPTRAPSLSVSALREALQEQLWPTYPLTVAQPAIPEALCAAPLAEQATRHVAVMGDSRADHAGIGPSARWAELTEGMLKRDPELIIHLGDWVTHGESLGEWRNALEAAIALKRPLLTVRGNHDRGAYWSDFHLDGFTSAHSEPAPLRVTRIGSTLVYLLDTEASEVEARASVEAHVEAYEEGLTCFKAEHIIWLQHRPVWSRGPHGSDERGWASWLVPSLDQLGVQLLLAGHDHNYERMRRSKGVGSARHPHPKGTLYITSGGAGTVNAPFPDLSLKVGKGQRAQDQTMSLIFSGEPHTLSLHIQSKMLKVEAWGTPRLGQHELLDEVLIDPLYKNEEGNADQKGIGIRRKGRYEASQK